MKKLNLNCPIGGTGYGITSLNIFKQLNEKEIDISLFPIGFNMSINHIDERNLIQKCLSYNKFFDYQAPCLKIWHQYDLAAKIGNGHYYSFPFFEVDTLTAQEVHNLNYCDFIFSASEWGKEILMDNGVIKPIYIAPLGVDNKIFNVDQYIRIEKNNYVFMHVGKYEKRKSQDFLLQCFENAFTEEDNVELWLMPFHGNINEKQQQEFTSLLEANSLRSKIKIYRPTDTQIELAKIISDADCGVFLSRAEGWNNEIIEFMSLNKPVIVTDYSAHTQYCEPDNAYLVDVEELEPAIDNVWFFGTGNWAKLDKKQMDQTVDYMRFVYNNNIRTNPFGLQTAQKYSWNNTANIIDQTLEKNGSYNASA
jgi:glycosyltransferase involved in cell wall biosynthesis